MTNIGSPEALQRVASFDEDELLPLSALQHLVFCERQCALIHLEQVWRDNPLTVEGSHLHARSHDTGPRREVRGDVVIARGLALRSFRLGVSGRADVVEFHRQNVPIDSPGQSETENASVPLDGLPGVWTPYPIEYKRGRPKADWCDHVQLCAQAICLEEMLHVAVSEGGLFYGSTKRRQDVLFTEDLRHATELAASRLHQLIRQRVTPRAEKAPKCKRCSLIDVCRPDVTGVRRSTCRSAHQYVQALARGACEELGTGETSP